MSHRVLWCALCLLPASAGLMSAGDPVERTPPPPALPVAIEDPPAKAPLPVQAGGELKPGQERNPRVVSITMKGCPPCYVTMKRLRAPGGPFWTLAGQGWKIGRGADNHIQILDRTEAPELIAKLNIHEYPTVACIQNGEIIRSFKDGCSTPLDVWTFGFLLKGENERPKGFVPEVIRVASTGSYPLRGNHWSVDGDWNPSHASMIGHLRGPNHSSQIAGNWAIESWSYEELRSLHDDLHEREMASSGASYADYSSGSSGDSGSFSAGRKMQGR